MNEEVELTKKLDKEVKIKQQETEFKQNDIAERAKRDLKTKFDEEANYEKQKRQEDESNAKKLIQQEVYNKRDEEEKQNRMRKKMEEEEAEEKKRLKKIDDDEVKMRREKELLLEEEDRKKRYVSPQLVSKLSEEKEKIFVDKSKKDDLLAKLALMDNKGSPKTYSKPTESLINNTKSTTNINNSSAGFGKSSSIQFNENFEKLYIDEKDSAKNDLLTKLFADEKNSPSAAKPKPPKYDIFTTQKFEDTSKTTLLPWEIQDVKSNSKMANDKGNLIKNDYLDFFSNLNNKETKDIVFGRPKIENKPINSFKNNNFVEDIEELSL